MKMKWLLWCTWSWVLLLVLMGSGRSILGCLKEERDALLQIKATFNHPNGSSLPSWRDDDGDCCRWEKVECEITTSRVTGLFLSETREFSDLWVIDASLFLPLEELRVLDLSYNLLSDLSGTLHLKKLKRLYLGDNYLERVPSLYKQASAEAQNLSSTNQLEDLNLEVLVLSDNYDLGNDALTLTEITRITSLKALNVEWCYFNASSKLLEGLCGLRNLEELVIGNNEFWGPLPSCFCNMTSLRALDVEDNYFTGAIPSCLLSDLKSLEYIDFSENAFEGSLSLASLANSSNLEEFRLIHNKNRLVVNTEEPTWVPSFQLDVFALSNCVVNEDANGIIPSFLKEQHRLGVVQLSHNGMTGDFPNWLLDNVHLEIFELRGNNLSGSFYLPSKLNLVHLWAFDVSANFIEGVLPSRIGYILPKLQYLNLSNNNLKGGIPSSMGNVKGLYSLDLSHNDFTGVIPSTLAEHCVSLSLLKLSANNLQGQILPRSSNLTNLQFLYLDNNRFTGNLSPAILKSSLRILDVSNNSLSGKIPDWIGDIKDLEMLILSSNSLGGPLPLSFCNLHHLYLLDLSSNNLGPNIPPCANVTIMRFLHLANDTLVGHFPLFLSRASSIVTLDLRHNALSGKIPNWIGSLWNLKALLLQGNNFEGLIPLDLCLLKNISILDLSRNNLIGKIPSCLKDLTFGKDGITIDESSTTESRYFGSIDYEGKFGLLYSSIGLDMESYYTAELEVVNFMTKRRLETYKGNILRLMSGLDLSLNNLMGFIPPEIGHLSELRALNLSYNFLTGPIPEMFSNLKEIESLDLSYNNLTGPIPAQLTKLYSLSNFGVAHNNLSGRIPDRKYQFGTFDKASYEGNPFLCGAPLRSCDDLNHESGTPPSLYHTREDDYWREAFWWSFAGSYIVAFLGVVLFLYLNSYYLCVMLNFIHKFIPSFPQ